MLQDQQFPRNTQVLIGHELFYDDQAPASRQFVSLETCQRFRRLQGSVCGFDFRLLLDEKFRPEFSPADFFKYLIQYGIHFVEVIVIDRVRDIKTVNDYAGLSDLIWAPSFQCMQNFVFRDRTSSLKDSAAFMDALETVALDIQGFDLERFRRLEHTLS